MPVSSLQANPIQHAAQRCQYVSYPAGCNGYSIPCHSRPESACEMRRRINEPDWTKPVCNLDGSYREYQCEAYSRAKCWCVYDNGMMIPGIKIGVVDLLYLPAQIRFPIGRECVTCLTNSLGRTKLTKSLGKQQIELST